MAKIQIRRYLFTLFTYYKRSYLNKIRLTMRCLLCGQLVHDTLLLLLKAVRQMSLTSLPQPLLEDNVRPLAAFLKLLQKETDLS